MGDHIFYHRESTNNFEWDVKSSGKSFMYIRKNESASI